MSIELNDIIIPARDALEDQLLAIIPDHPGLPDPMMATSTGTAGLLWLWDAVDAHVIMGSVLLGHRRPRPGTGVDGVPADLRHQRLRGAGRSYRYRYLLDGQRWEDDRQADRYVPNALGSTDSI